MEKKKKALTEKQLELIEAVVDYLLIKREKGYKFQTTRVSIETALIRWRAYSAMISNCPQGFIGSRELRYLIDVPTSSPLKIGKTYEYSSLAFVDIKEAKKIIENHYTRPKVWRPADTMPSAIDQAPIIYAIIANDKIARIDMSVFDLPDSSPEVLWQFVCKFYKINFWAYPKDILPSDDERGTVGTAL